MLKPSTGTLNFALEFRAQGFESDTWLFQDLLQHLVLQMKLQFRLQFRTWDSE